MASYLTQIGIFPGATVTQVRSMARFVRLTLARDGQQQEVIQMGYAVYSLYIDGYLAAKLREENKAMPASAYFTKMGFIENARIIKIRPLSRGVHLTYRKNSTIQTSVIPYSRYIKWIKKYVTYCTKNRRHPIYCPALRKLALQERR